MTAIRAYARARAVASGFATPVASVRHLHIAERPLVFVPLTMAGEANAPLAAMVGTDQDRPTLLIVPQPRNRDLRFGFAAALADVLIPYLDGFAPAGEDAPAGPRPADGPQILVPNPGGVGFVRMFGRSTRFRRTTGEYAVGPSVPILGRWLTFLAECAEQPGSSMILAATDALALHWATGQSALEDANLAVLMGWVDPPPGTTGALAARLAEDPAMSPAAGPTTDPRFDIEVLAPAIAAYDAATAALAGPALAGPALAATAESDSPARRAAVTGLEAALREQLEPTWNLMWRTVALLRGLRPGASVADRWERDRARFVHTFMAEEGRPRARRDGAVAAARRLNRMELAQAALDAERALDDPLVMADHRIGGEAFAGTVVAVERGRRIPGGTGKGRLVTRPLITVRTEDPVGLAVGSKVIATTRRRQDCVIWAVDHRDGHALVTVEARSGMGRASVPAPGTVAEPGDTLCYSGVLADSVRSVSLPEVADTPWTHGGPPAPYEPSDDDAGEAWE